MITFYVPDQYIYIYVPVYVYIHTYIFIHVYICSYICIHIYTYIHTYICTCIYIFIPSTCLNTLKTTIPKNTCFAWISLTPHTPQTLLQTENLSTENWKMFYWKQNMFYWKKNMFYWSALDTMGWLRLVGFWIYRSLLQKSPTTEMIFCKRDV